MDENESGKTVKVLIACKDRGKANAERFAEIYNPMFEVEYGMDLDDFDSAFEYAEKEKKSHLLFFIDEVHLRLASLLDDMGGYTINITVDDLEKVLSQNAYDNL